MQSPRLAVLELTLTVYQHTDRIIREEDESLKNVLRCGAVSDDCLVAK
jgi:hypothetical protein